MRMKHRGGILGMELSADEPAMVRNFDNLNQAALRVRPYALHAVFLVFVLIMVVELIAVAVTFANLECAIGLSHTAALAEFTAVSTQTHGATHVGHGFLFFHEVNHVVRGFRVHLA